MIGILGGIGFKTILMAGSALAMASCGAYTIHTLKAAGANEVALEISQATLEAQDAARRKERAAVARLTDSNAKLQGEAKTRQKALNDALAAIPSAPATDLCPANCLLPSSS